MASRVRICCVCWPPSRSGWDSSSSRPGATSDYYIDCRTTTLSAKGARLTGQVFLDEIRARRGKPKAIGGLTMGADPIVVAVSVASGDLEGFLVRKAEKQHGTGRRIEGFQEKGARVVIVDDVCTTGILDRFRRSKRRGNLVLRSSE